VCLFVYVCVCEREREREREGGREGGRERVFVQLRIEVRKSGHVRVYVCG